MHKHLCKFRASEMILNLFQNSFCSYQFGYFQVTIANDTKCKEAMTSLTIVESMLCAGGQGAGPCKV